MNKYKRVFPRHKQEIPIHYTNMIREDFYESRIYNFSKGGIYFKPACSITPDSNVGILMDHYSPGTFGPEAYRFYLVRIKWCEPIPESDNGCYEAGAEIVAKSHEVILGDFQENLFHCDLCGRLMLMEDLHQEEKSVHLCSECHSHFKQIPDGHIKESIRRFIIGNVI